ncbi:MAG: YicC/YloC family endoribonuclease [Phycisphaerae bacterium]
MLRSMTGFGSASGQAGTIQYSVEVRSVNNRYLKTNIKLPESCQAAEPRIEKRLSGRVQRGTVTVTVRMRLSEDAGAYRVNHKVLDSYLQQLRNVQAEADPAARIDLASMLELPGVCEPPAVEEIILESIDALLGLVDQAIDGLIDMREKEGAALRDVLLGQCQAIDWQLEGVKKRAPGVIQDYHDRLSTRVNELIKQARLSIDQDTLAREVAIFAERSDIAEEIARLDGHIEQFRQALDGGDAVGRKLDFIAQEMLREANTIASKANDAEIGRAVVEIKTAIDRIKEQVQNAE